MEDSRRILVSTLSTVMLYSVVGVFVLNIPDKKIFNVPKKIEIYIANIDKQMEQEEAIQHSPKQAPKQIKKIEKLTQKNYVKQILTNKQLTQVANKEEFVNSANAIKNSIDSTKNIIHTVVKNQNETATPQKQHMESIITKYLGLVREKIQAEIKYPITAKRIGLEGETIVRFRISSDGSVRDGLVEIVKSSTNSSFDKSAIDAVLDASLFDKPPVVPMEIVVPVVFKLNKG